MPTVPATPGKTAVELFDAMQRGEIKAVWIACTNPAQSMPDHGARARGARSAPNSSCCRRPIATPKPRAYADLLLPATTWGEKEGTVTNSERRISRVRAAVPAPGEARADWAIAADFALRLGRELGRCRAPHACFRMRRPKQMFNEHRETTRGRDLDITGLSYAMLERAGPQQWPLPEGAPTGTPRLYADGVFPTASGRARFAARPYIAPTAETDRRALSAAPNTGRLRDQWHGMSRTGTVARLFNHAGEPRARDERARHGAPRGSPTATVARLKSRRGESDRARRGRREMRAGQAFMPMHWGSQFMAAPASTR